ncbi:zinc metallopeptidase [Bacteroidota bacterium]
MISYIIIFGAFMLASWLISYQLKSRFKKYSQIPMSYGLSGKDIAVKMLKDNNIHNVRIISVNGQLTDHYNSLNKTINLSSNVFNGNHIAAVAVAAHECGHAIQHANAYVWLKLRSSLVPVVSFSSRWIQWILMGGIFLINVFPHLLLIGIVLFAMTTLFSLITLPVEINASRRAMSWLINSGLISYVAMLKAKDALKWAACTYIITTLGSLATLFYYLMILFGKRKEIIRV